MDDINKTLKSHLRNESIKHLEALNELFGYEPPSSDASLNYWLFYGTLCDNNVLTFRDQVDTEKPFFKKDDLVLFFNAATRTCTGSYLISDISEVGDTYNIVLTESIHFALPVSIEAISIHSIISSRCKEAVNIMQSKGYGLIDADDFNTIVKMARTPSKVDVKPETVKKLLGDEFVISEDLLGRICASLNSGNHVILSGPPGTGKTTLAQAVAIAARGVPPVVTTATADWSTFDTVGGYMPDLTSTCPNALTFESGIILQSIIDRRWLIIDEINRAPIDKAIGQLFTVLSGGDVLLPFRNTKTGNRLRIVSDNMFSSEDVFTRTEDWRIIATMNEYDKNALFDMSYAFMRRFAIIRVGLPDNYADVVGTWANAASIMPDIVTNMKEIIIEHMHKREIGPAIFKSIIAYMIDRQKMGSKHLLYYAEALSIFLIPQLQGIDEDIVRSFADTIVSFLSADKAAQKHFVENLYAVTGYLIE